MSVPQQVVLDETAGRVTLRPEAPADETFLSELYASTRREELDGLGWGQASRQAFLAQQFFAMQQGYHQNFPTAAFSIVLVDGGPVGRLIVDRRDEEIRIVDAALLPGQRNLGVGTALVRGVLAEAAAAGKPVRLRVLRGGRSAHLCERLGFRRIESDGAHEHWEWRPANGGD